MNKNSLKLLTGAAALLIVVLLAMQLIKPDAVSNNALLFPDLRDKVNDVTTITITRAGDETPTVIRKTAEAWVVESRDDYPADVSKLRAIMLGLAAAKTMEQKTANPDLYGQLGVDDPAIENSKGTRLQVTGADMNYDIVIGNVAQPGTRYVRNFSESPSWLIDKDPAIPDSAAEWMLKDLIDLQSAAVRAVTITHPDGEQIRISRESADVTDFTVADIPQDRELKYATVANGISSALAGLKFDDVRKGDSFEGDVVSGNFETFAGDQIVVLTSKANDETWISLAVIAGENVGGNADETSSANENTGVNARAISERVSGWQYKIAEYKADQLTRRWDDILKAEAATE